MVAVGRNVLTLVVLLAGCRQILGLENGTVVELDGPVDVADSLETGAAYRKVITIESPAGEELIDFPVPIMRGVDLDLAAHAAETRVTSTS